MRKLVVNSFTCSLVILAVFITPTKALAVPIQNLNGATGATQTFQGDPNVTISTNPATNTHSLGWFGQLPISRGGTGVDSFTAGSLLFYNGSTFAQDNSNFFWDDTNNRLGIGTNSPTTTLDISGNTKITGNLDVTGNITGNVTVTNVVPYTGATGNVNLGTYNLTANKVVSNTDATINGVTVGLGGGSNNSNTAFGMNALSNNNTTSYNNTAFGRDALLNNTTGLWNTAVGLSALSASNSTKSTAVGAHALENNSTAEENTAIGVMTLRYNTTGELNTALGGEALYSNTTGSRNTALGLKSLGNNNGDDNIAIGFYSLLQNITGSGNIAIGERAGFWAIGNSGFLTSPMSNIFIGNRTRANNSDSNSIVIGHEAEAAGSNTAVIGHSGMTDVYFGSSSANANTHAKKMFLGSPSTPGCIIMGDTAGGVGYITLDGGVLTVSPTAPIACQ